MNRSLSHDLTRTTLAVLFLCLLIATSFWILRPFLTALIWAAMIAVATWPLLLGMQARLGRRRWLAVLVMTVLLLLILIVPVTIAIATIVGKSDEIIAWAKSPSAWTLPPPPDWVVKLPLGGPKIAEQWANLATAGPGELAGTLRPYASKIAGWFVAEVGSLGMVLLQFLLTVIICAVLYSHGEQAADRIRRFARRLAGERGESAAILAAKAIRGVALGVVVTALIQAVLGGIGLAVTGVPAVMILTAVMFFLCIAQLGPVLVMLPAIIWLFWKDHAAAGSVLIVWTIVTGTVDNFIRPILIKKGADLPLLLIFAGVIGGLLSFGIIGLFIGPVVLAVSHTLLEAWLDVDKPISAVAVTDDSGLER